MTKKIGRPASTEPMKDRSIRMTDVQWQVFKEKLGPKWLRDQINKVASNQ